MATINATMKGFTKGLKEAIKPMENSLSTIAKNIKVGTTSSLEENLEAEAYKEDRDRDVAKREKEQSTTLSGMWKSIKEGNKENWFVENWKKIALGLFVLFPKNYSAKISENGNIKKLKTASTYFN